MARKPTELSKKPEKPAKNKPPVDSKPKCCALESVKPRLCPECTQGNGKKRRKIDVDKITEKYQKKVPYELFRGWKLDTNLIVPETCSQCGNVLDEANYILELKYQGQQAPARLELSCPEDLAMIQFLFGGKHSFQSPDRA